MEYAASCNLRHGDDHASVVIAAAQCAIQRAGWSDDEALGIAIGVIYGVETGDFDLNAALLFQLTPRMRRR